MPPARGKGVGDQHHRRQVHVGRPLAHQPRHAVIQGGVFLHDAVAARHGAVVDLQDVAAVAQHQRAVVGDDADVPGLRPLLAEIQIGASLLAAVFLLAFGLIRLGLLREPQWLAALAPERLPGFGRVLEKSLQSGGGLSFLGMGLLLGLLPCGLSYAAFIRALAAGGFAPGFFLVLAFAAGTVPGLLLLGTGFSAVARRHRRASDLLSGALMLLMALDMVYTAVGSVV